MVEHAILRRHEAKIGRGLVRLRQQCRSMGTVPLDQPHFVTADRSIASRRIKDYPSFPMDNHLLFAHRTPTVAAGDPPRCPKCGATGDALKFIDQNTKPAPWISPTATSTMEAYKCECGAAFTHRVLTRREAISQRPTSSNRPLVLQAPGRREDFNAGEGVIPMSRGEGKRERRWHPRFSVRTLAIVVTLVCAHFAA
jgi:hypothetical protein